jgi:GNAT superfamily N-acetyltransferase
MENFLIKNLVDTPHLIDKLAEYWNQEWSTDKSEKGIEKQKSCIKNLLNLDKVPFILVACHGQKLIGSAALFLNDLDSRPDLSPWLGGIYTVPEHRGKGIAKTMIEKVINKAKTLGYHKIYLHTEHTAGLYRKLGWKKLCNTKNDQGEDSEIYYLDI